MKRERDAEPDRRAGQRRRQCSRTRPQQQPAVDETGRRPFGDQGETDHCERQCPQLGLVVDRDPTGGEQSRRERDRRREEPQRPTIVDRIRRHRRPDDGAPGAGQPRRPPAQHDDGDQHRHPNQTTDEQVSEEHQRHAHQREEGSVVQIRAATDHEPLRAGDRRIHREAATPERPSLFVVEVGPEPRSVEQLPRPPRRGHQPEDHDGDDCDDPHHGVGRDTLAIRRPRGVVGSDVRLGAGHEVRRHVTSRAGRAGAAPSRVEPRTGRRTAWARRDEPIRHRSRRHSRARRRRRARRAEALRTTRLW